MKYDTKVWGSEWRSFFIINANNKRESSLDKVDFRIIGLLVKGHENKQISKRLRVPLSTIQRRTKNIIDSGVVRTKTVPDFKKLGIKQGLLHIYLRDGNIRQSASQIAKMDGIMSASIHVGNSDVVGQFVYEDSDQLVDIIAAIKHMNNVHIVKWSEEVSELPVNSGNVLSSFKKFWNGNRNNGNNKQTKSGSNKMSLQQKKVR